jgi:hypothetical protein
VRANPWLAVGIALAALLILAWLGWAIHITSDHGAREGLGVLVAWPAIAAAVALISLPFIWAFRVIRASRGAGESTIEPGKQATEDAEQEAGAEASDSAPAEATESG